MFRFQDLTTRLPATRNLLTTEPNQPPKAGKYLIWRQTNKDWTCCWLKDAWSQADSEPVP
jgi:hypothetical protein